MRKKVFISILIVLVIIALSTIVFADEITSSMQGISPSTGNSQIAKAGGKIVGILQAIGISVAVIMLTVIAIRFMIASAEGKAQIKEQMTPYIIGAVLICAISILPYFMSIIGNQINKTAGSGGGSGGDTSSDIGWI